MAGRSELLQATTRKLHQEEGRIVHYDIDRGLSVISSVVSMVVEIQPLGVIFKNSFIFYCVFCYSSLVVELLEIGDFAPLSIIVQFIKHPVVNK